MSSGRILLKKNEERRLLAGHLWVFSNEIASVEGAAGNGDILPVFSFRGNLLGYGFYNKQSLIAVRLLTRHECLDIDELIRRNLKRAFALRASLYPNRTAYRAVYGESDFLPGLVIDRYNDTYILQIHSAGMEQKIGVILDYLRSIGARAAFSRSDWSFRKMEGLPEEDTIFFGEPGKEIVSVEGMLYEIEFDHPQKTGFFFDQARNRTSIEQICSGKNVLDAFCFHGGFGLHALRAGASHVTFVDISKAALDTVVRNRELNALPDRLTMVVSDVFEFLKNAGNSKSAFDVVMIDPPAFAKSKKHLPQALQGYEKLHKLAFRVTAPGGFLVTSSCSHHIDSGMFIDIIRKASRSANREVQLLSETGAALDHPVLPAMPETAYLKCIVCRIS